MKDLTAGGVLLRKGDMLTVDMYHLGNNEREWQ
jgi:hypothetical protein